MNWGDFRDYFRGFAWKRLTAHEVDPQVSNGHEFQGVGKLRQILGTSAAERLPTTYVLLHEDSDDVEVVRLWSKWYDARAGNPDRSAEWRLYYPAEADAIQARMKRGDLVIFAVTQAGELVVLFASAASDRERQLQVLFSIDDGGSTALKVTSLTHPVAMDYITATILEAIGIAPAVAPTGGDSALVAAMIEELQASHPDSLPAGQVVAGMVRSRLKGIDAVADPDEALFRWIEAEAAMYRGWEDGKIAARLRVGFVLPDGDVDVADFRRFSMSLRQSRVSRAGGALQYHIRELLDARRIRYAMEPEIDGGELPDFLFPSKEAYNDSTFPVDQLRMLAAKFTAKDRWRQVLNEAHRIPHKHLLTLEAAISRKQTGLMQRANLTLVMPAQIRERYPADQANQIVTVRAFLDELHDLQ